MGRGGGLLAHRKQDAKLGLPTLEWEIPRKFGPGPGEGKVWGKEGPPQVKCLGVHPPK